MVAQQIDGSNLVEARQKVETLCRRHDAPLPQAVYRSFGPGHQLHWTASLEVGGLVVSSGEGESKRRACMVAFTSLAERMSENEVHFFEAFRDRLELASFDPQDTSVKIGSEVAASPTPYRLERMHATATVQQAKESIRMSCTKANLPFPEAELHSSGPVIGFNGWRYSRLVEHLLPEEPETQKAKRQENAYVQLASLVASSGHLLSGDCGQIEPEVPIELNTNCVVNSAAAAAAANGCLVVAKEQNVKNSTPLLLAKRKSFGPSNSAASGISPFPDQGRTQEERLP